MKKSKQTLENIVQNEPDIVWRSQGHKLISKMIQTSSWVRKISTDIAEEFNLTTEQGSLLRALNDKNGVPVSTNELRQLMLTPMSDTPKIVDRLLSKGLVNKETDPNDKRLVAVTITPKGKELVENLAVRSISVWDNIPGFSVEDIMQLTFYLDKLKAGLKQLSIHHGIIDKPLEDDIL